ncbi:MAG: DMT family transporter [Pseudomonadota bacterium]
MNDIQKQSAVRAPLAYGSLLLGVSLLAWAPILVRVAETSAVATAFWRSLLALPVFAVILKSQDYRLIQTHWRLFAWCGLGLGGDLALWHMSIARIDVGAATVLVNLAPLFVGLWAMSSARQGIALFFLAHAIALVGVSLLVGVGTDVQSGAGVMSPLGVACGLAAAVFNALYLIAAAKLRPFASARVIMAGTTFVMAIGLGALALITGGTTIPLSREGWLTLAALALLIQVFGQGLVIYALAALPVTFTSLSLVVQTTGAAVLGWVLFNEVLGHLQIIGALLAIGAVILASRTISRR